MNCGVIFHNYNSTRVIFDSNNGKVSDFSMCGELLEKDAINTFNNIVEVSLSINEDSELIAKASREIPLDISISGFLKGHTRCVSVNESTYKIWGQHFESGHRFSKEQRMTVGYTPVAIDGNTIADSFEKIREHEYYSKLNADDPNDFRINDGKKTTIREYLKPTAIELGISITSPDGIPVAIKEFTGSVKYEFELKECVTWKLWPGINVTMIPSTYRDFDIYVDGDKGSEFTAETVVLTPKVTYNTQNIYYLPY